MFVYSRSTCVYLMEKEEHNPDSFGKKCKAFFAFCTFHLLQFLCILYFLYSGFFVFYILRMLHFSQFVFVAIFRI